MKRLIILILFIAFSMPTQAVADCSTTACVDVFTENNQIIITARKGNGGEITKKPLVARPIPKPTLWFPPKPKPVPTVKRTYKPRTKTKKVGTQSINLSDRLIKMVPTATIAYQPEFEPLVHVPIIFWCDLPTLFQSRINIIGEVIDVALRPGFAWQWGDGQIFQTNEPGAPYPNQKITHTYKQPGTYAVTLIATWNGTFAHQGATRAITGTVKIPSFAVITVVAANTRFTK
ncbi:MAG: PKD domain-containing protein [Actinomycetes bacterium]